MLGPRIVTALVLISMSVGCKAKFRSVNKPGEPTASFDQNAPPPPPSNQGPQQPQGPAVPPPSEQPPQQQPPQGPTGPVAKNPPPAPPPATLPPKQTRICQTGGDQSLDRSRTISHRTVVFRRPVIAQDCYGQPVQYGAPETTKTIILRAGAQGPMSIYNRSTCHATEAQGMVNCDQRGDYRFTVSIQRSNRAMYVRPGVNLIDYESGPYKGTLVLTVHVENGQQQPGQQMTCANCGF